MGKKDKQTALVRLERAPEEITQALRGDIKQMVVTARAQVSDDVLKVLDATREHADELIRAIGDISQAEALEGVRRFFLEEMTRVLDRY